MNSPPRLPRDNRFVYFCLALFLIGFAFFVPSVLIGRRVLLSNYIWPSDLFWGLDLKRNIRDMTEWGYAGRSNVHPLFPHMLKPLCKFIQNYGLTSAVSAIVVNSACGMLALWLTAAYARLRNVSRIDAALLALLMAGSSLFIIEGTLPGTFIFSLCVIAVGHILLAFNLKYPDESLAPWKRWTREAGWVLTGVLNYGITVTNGMMSFITYVFSRKGKFGWLRAAAYGALVLAIGFGLTIWFRSSTDLLLERRWTSDTPERGPNLPHPIFHSISSTLFWSVVGPTPQVTETLDIRHWQIVAYHHWIYSPLGWLLAIAWLVLFGMAVWAMIKNADPISRRLTGALLACLAFHITLHCFFYVSWEGTFNYNGHSQFMVIGLLVPLLARIENWESRAKWGLRAVILILALALAVRHFKMLLDAMQMIPLPKPPYP